MPNSFPFPFLLTHSSFSLLAFLIFLPSLPGFLLREPSLHNPHPTDFRPGGGCRRAGRVWAQGTFPPQLPMLLLSCRPGARAEKRRAPRRSCRYRAQRFGPHPRPPPPRLPPTGYRARTLPYLSRPRAALAHPAATAETRAGSTQSKPQGLDPWRFLQERGTDMPARG